MTAEQILAWVISLVWHDDLCVSTMLGTYLGLLFPWEEKPPQTEHDASAHNFSAIHFSNYFFPVFVSNCSKYWIFYTDLSPDPTDTGIPAL